MEAERRRPDDDNNFWLGKEKLTKKIYTQLTYTQTHLYIHTHTRATTDGCCCFNKKVKNFLHARRRQNENFAAIHCTPARNTGFSKPHKEFHIPSSYVKHGCRSLTRSLLLFRSAHHVWLKRTDTHKLINSKNLYVFFAQLHIHICFGSLLSSTSSSSPAKTTATHLWPPTYQSTN